MNGPEQWQNSGKNDLGDTVSYSYIGTRHRIKRVVRQGKLYSLKRSPAYIPQYAKGKQGVFTPYADRDGEVIIRYTYAAAYTVISRNLRRVRNG